jgi:hypothetical protein
VSSRRTRRAFVATAAAGGASWLLATHSTVLLAQRRAPTPVSGYRVVNAYPHDPDAYTQGLIYRGGFLYESTGRNGVSTLRKVKLETGAVLQQRHVDSQYFAEGLTEWKGRLFQLTWQSNVAFVYDLASFEPAAEPARAEPLYLRVAEGLRATGLTVEIGRFGADMKVELVNDGPVTFVLETRAGALVK